MATIRRSSSFESIVSNWRHELAAQPAEPKQSKSQAACEHCGANRSTNQADMNSPMTKNKNPRSIDLATFGINVEQSSSTNKLSAIFKCCVFPADSFDRLGSQENNRKKRMRSPSPVYGIGRRHFQQATTV